MKDFDARWQKCLEGARKSSRRQENAPFGFASRVVARAYSSSELTQEEVFGQLAFRMLAGAAAVLLLCAAVEAPHLRDSRPLETRVEDTVAQLVWSL